MTYAGWIEARFAQPTGVTLNATTNGGGPTLVTPTPGTYHLEDFLAEFIFELNNQRPVTAGSWVGTYSTTTGKVTLSVTAGTFSIAWIDTEIRDLLGFAGNITSVASATGDYQARSLFIPDCPLSLDVPDTAQAPRDTDRRSTSSPTGYVLSHKGTSKYLHTGLRYSHVARNKVFLGSEITVNESWERFLMDVAWNEGLSWFSGDAFVKVYDLQSLAVGRNQGLAGWYMRGRGINSLMPRGAQGSETMSLYFVLDGIDLESDG